MPGAQLFSDSRRFKSLHVIWWSPPRLYHAKPSAWGCIGSNCPNLPGASNHCMSSSGVHPVCITRNQAPGVALAATVRIFQALQITACHLVESTPFVSRETKRLGLHWLLASHFWGCLALAGNRVGEICQNMQSRVNTGLLWRCFICERVRCRKYAPLIAQSA